MFKALKSFCGKVSMKQGEVKDLEDEEAIKDLLNAGYIAEINNDVEEVETKDEEEVEKIEENIVKEVKKTRTSRKKK